MATPAGPISAKLFSAIQKVETGGSKDPETQIGDGGRAIGPFQIHEIYWKDAVQHDPSLTASGETWKGNCMGSGSWNYSERVMQAYMSRYATKGRLGHDPTDEDMARIHNGGPNGWKKEATVPYWEKVKKNL